jgi:outer membrane lipoprotein SlyB
MKLLAASVAGAAMLVSVTTVLGASATSISYGVVASAITVKDQSKHAGGAVAGGLLGAVIGGPRHRGLRILGGAAAGAAIQGTTSGYNGMQYTVKLVTGGQVVVTTEQTDIRQGDCVTVEQGDHANIRRASSVHCEEPVTTKAPAHHVAASDSCQAAKTELINASSDDAIDQAVKKVRVLCED